MITLENKNLLVKISRGRGARVEHFIDRHTGKDWVWKYSPELKKELHELDGFDENWEGGWEEVFPNDAPVEINQFKLTDHGELWRRTWELIPSEDPNEAVFELECETYPVIIQKKFLLKENELKIDYKIESRAAMDLPFIFKFHPALAIEPGDEFHMPGSYMEPVALGFSRLLGIDKKTVFPIGVAQSGEYVNIQRALPEDGHSREFVRLSDLEEGMCAVFNPGTGTRLTFQFPKDKFPYVWLFQSYGGFNGHYVSMLEPTNAGHYDLGEAHKNQQCGEIRPGEKLDFSLSLKLESSDMMIS